MTKWGPAPAPARVRCVMLAAGRRERVETCTEHPSEHCTPAAAKEIRCGADGAGSREPHDHTRRLPTEAPKLRTSSPSRVGFCEVLRSLAGANHAQRGKRQHLGVSNLPLSGRIHGRQTRPAVLAARSGPVRVAKHVSRLLSPARGQDGRGSVRTRGFCRTARS